MDDQNKNLILATALSFLVILVWFVLFPPPEPELGPDPATQNQEATNEAAPIPAAPDDTEAAPLASANEPAPSALESAARIPIETGRAHV